MKKFYVCNVQNQYGGGNLPEPLAMPKLYADEPPVGAHNAANWPDPPQEPSAASVAANAATGGPLPAPLICPAMEFGG